jgi:hypothetical protein
MKNCFLIHRIIVDTLLASWKLSARRGKISQAIRSLIDQDPRGKGISGSEMEEKQCKSDDEKFSQV